MKSKRSINRIAFNIINYGILIAAAVLCVIPLVNVLAVSISSSTAAAANQVSLVPVGFNLSAYSYVLERSAFWVSFRITIVRCLLGIVLNVTIAILMAYPLSKSSRELFGRNVYMGLLIFAMLFNGGLVPFMLTMKSLGLMDTLWGLVLPTAVPIYSVLLVMNNIKMLPKEVEESARIDGASYPMTLFKILVPMLRPVIATITLFSFVNHYNAWFDGLVLMNDIKKYPLQTFLSQVVRSIDVKSMEETKMYKDINNRTLKAAQLFISLVPILLIYPFLQKFFTKGLIVGSVKG